MKLRITWDTPNSDGDLSVDRPSVMTVDGDDKMLRLVAAALADNLPEWLASALYMALDDRLRGAR